MIELRETEIVPFYLFIGTVAAGGAAA